MEIYGKNAIGILLAVSICASICFAQQYAVNTYDEDSPGFPKRIKTVFIDLENKNIIESVVIGEQGQIINKTPLVIKKQSDSLLITVVMERCYCDNATLGQTRARITLFDFESIRILDSYDDTSLFITSLEQLEGERIYMSGSLIYDHNRTIKGIYTLNNVFHLNLEESRSRDYSYNLLDGINNFDLLELVDTRLNLYKTSNGSQRFILRINNSRDQLLDSLVLDNEPYRSQVFAIKDTLIYVFNQNYEIHMEFTTKNREDNWIDSHVKLYDLSDFSLIDSIPLPDYPENDYIGGDFNKADVVGDFIVYYFFGREGLTRYAPAMLFIFDTRTNEASWLRVGWR